MLPRRSVASNLDALADAWAWTGDDVLAHGLPLFHVHGLGLGVLGPLRRGGELRHLGRFEPAAAAAALRGGATMLFGVPTMYHRLAREAEQDPAIAAGPARGAAARLGLRAAARARLHAHRGADRPADRRALRAHRDADEHGGARRRRRAAPATSACRSRASRSGSSPTTAPTSRSRDDETIGEVAVRGPNVFSGYLNRPDATAEAIRDGWFFTGDIATRAPDGYWRIVGRRSTDLIKTGGYKVGAGEIEVALLEHPAVREAAVTGAPDDDLGERIVAWVVAEGGARPAERELIDHVAARARAAQAAARGALPRRAAPQRDGQGRQGAAELKAATCGRG